MSLSICEIKHILEAIFLCFDMKDLLLCREVSKRFKTTIDNPTFIIRKFKHYSNFWGIFWKSRLKILPREYSTQDRTFYSLFLLKLTIHPECREYLLHTSADLGNLNTVELLLEWYKWKPSVIDDWTMTKNERILNPLCVAATKGHLNIVKKLLKYGCSVFRSTTSDKWTLLHFAAENGHFAVVDFILKSVKKVRKLNIRNIEGDFPIHIAARNGFAEIVKALIYKFKRPDRKGSRNSTPIHSASTNGHVNVVKILLDFKANWIFANDFGNTALHFAAWFDNIEVVKLIIDFDQEISPNIRNENLWTPLHFSVNQGNFETAKLLLPYTKDIVSKDIFGRTIAEIAETWSTPDELDTFLQYLQNRYEK